MAQDNMVNLVVGPGVRQMATRIAGSSTYSLATLGTGFAIRHQAEDTAPVTAVRIYWTTISAPGQITVSYQTIDPITGLPNGLYDANATKIVTPTAGWQTITFDSAPTTARTRGQSYAIVILTTTGGTTHTLRLRSGTSYAAGLPSFGLTTTDGGSTWTEYTTATANASVVTASGDQIGQMFPWDTTTTVSCYGNRAAGARVVLPHGLRARYATAVMVGTGGTLDGDVTIRALDVSKEPCALGAAGYVVATATIDKDSLANANTRNIQAQFDTADWSVGGGTFRLVLQQMSGNNASNYVAPTYDVGPITLGLTNWLSCTTTDISASPIVWTETDYHLALIELGLQSYTAPGYPPRILSGRGWDYEEG